jgi:hemoglobin-like flavoprotein
MTPKQIQLIEDSWDFVILNTENAGLIFYGKLFELDPSLRSLFKEDITEQSQKLISLITFAVSKLDNLGEIINDVKALGQRHFKYNVKPEHYNAVGAALLVTLESALGNQWDEEMKQAWTAVYTVLSQVMIDATKEVA